MRTMYVRSVIVASLGLLSFLAGANAQERPGLLNAVEVRQLVDRGDPADHARLNTHFTALADQYTSQARRHTAMAKSFGGNPNRGLGTGSSAHCRRLAELNTQSAATVRELAQYHVKLAAGNPATPPSDAARFQAGAGAHAPTEQDLTALAARASTPADHRALQEYFLTLARGYAAEARSHESFAMVYRGSRVPQVGTHHERLAGLARQAAEEATDAGEMHGALAGVAR